MFGESLSYPNFDSQFILTTDASKTALAAILSQIQDGVERPIRFTSRQHNPAESRYSASELEMLAVSWATRHFPLLFVWQTVCAENRPRGVEVHAQLRRE